MKKKIFTTPKRTVMICAGVLCSLAVVGTGSVFAAGAVAESNAIGEEAARQLAFSDAGVPSGEATVRKTEFEFEKNKFVYDIEFYHNGVEYDYTVNGKDGAILKKETETADLPLANLDTAVLSLNEAKAIVLSDAGLTADAVTFTETELDRDDGRLFYELDFVTADTKYEYKVNAESGNIVKKQNKSLTLSPTEPSVSPAPLLSLDEAKAVALTDAGFTTDKVTFLKERLEKDDGREEYDLEFVAESETGKKKYEYDIDASTGKILSKDEETVKNNTQTSTPAPEATPAPEVTPTPNTSSTRFVGTDKAKEIALRHAGVSANEATFAKVETDREKGRTVYEIEFYVGRVEYEYEIDAVTGDILDYEKDIDD